MPAKGRFDAKTRLGSVLDAPARGALALAFLGDALAALARVPAVARVLVVTDDDAVAEVVAEVPPHLPHPTPDRRSDGKPRVSAPEAAVSHHLSGGVGGASGAGRGERAGDETGGGRFAVVAEGGRRGLNAAIELGLERAAEADPGNGRAVLLGDLPALDPLELAAALDAAAQHPLALVADANGTGTVLATARPGVPLVPQFGAGSALAHAEAGHAPLTGAWPSLRRDVDTPDELAEAVALGVGPRTRTALAALRATGRPV